LLHSGLPVVGLRRLPRYDGSHLHRPRSKAAGQRLACRTKTPGPAELRRAPLRPARARHDASAILVPGASYVGHKCTLRSGSWRFVAVAGGFSRSACRTAKMALPSRNPAETGFRGQCRRRDSNPRHADYDPARLWLSHREFRACWTRGWTRAPAGARHSACALVEAHRGTALGLIGEQADRVVVSGRARLAATNGSEDGERPR
jgi:hypothetical protein